MEAAIPFILLGIPLFIGYAIYKSGLFAKAKDYFEDKTK